uniref:C-type lectin domain-containing protein n=1 Tax=Seriola lalandi dorsalis TaxID=1841481 RepID=A0A3B4XCV3_SERLL
MQHTGKWKDLDCGLLNFFLCLNGNLVERYYSYAFTCSRLERYVYYSQEKSWDDSQEHCRSKHNDLAYVKTGADNSEIANLIEAWIGSFLLPKNAWIGLFKDAWMWSDGRETSFRYWLKGWHYSGDCAAVAVPQQGRWVAANCNQKTTFVCQGGEFLRL